MDIFLFSFLIAVCIVVALPVFDLHWEEFVLSVLLISIVAFVGFMVIMLSDSTNNVTSIYIKETISC